MIFHDLLSWVSLHCIIIAYLNIIYIQGPTTISSFVTEAVTMSKYLLLIYYYYYYYYSDSQVAYTTGVFRFVASLLRISVVTKLLSFVSALTSQKHVMPNNGTIRSTSYPEFFIVYRRIPKVTAPVTFGFSRPKGPLLSGSRYFQVAVTFGWLKNVCNSAAVLHKEDV